MTTPTLEELEAAEQQAMVRVAEARAAARVLRDQREQRRTEAERAHDEQVLVKYRDDRADLEAAVATAQEHFQDAVLADPTFAALAELMLAQHRVVTRAVEASGATGRLGGQTWTPAGAPPPPDFEQVVRLVEQHAHGRGRAEQQARERAREAVGQAAADGAR